MGIIWSNYIERKFYGNICIIRTYVLFSSKNYIENTFIMVCLGKVIKSDLNKTK